MNLKLMLLVSGAFCICAEGSHTICGVLGCFDSSDTQHYMTLDDEFVYVNLKKDPAVWESKITTYFRLEDVLEHVKTVQQICKIHLSEWKPDTSVIKTKNPPDIVIFPRNEVVVRKENTLICFINNFFPPKINITWTKNDEIISTEDPFTQTVSNSDGLFHVFSYLNFVPKDGDNYSCTVEHAALEQPKTRFWDLEGEEHKKISGSGPAVFCGIAVTLGLFGIAAGTFFFVKGQKHHSNLY
ncbi:H-2 class II histocompatibility antigen, A-Q alpha chain isoform X1 [Nothobranchius furzeri]|uniref:Transcript variant X1 n=2 Tax=Nothobranchius furzeri TaxID=105023 RepID=A0A1A8AKN8_NOTFU|nr:transcript variant X1 [Nothobranchius furzeri]